MPVFDMFLAHDVSCYGSVEIEADTFAEAVEMLRNDRSYFDNCSPDHDTDFDHRIVGADAGEGTIADDISIDCSTMSIGEAVLRLRELASKDTLSAAELRAEATRLADQWEAYQKPDSRAVARADRELEENQ